MLEIVPGSLLFSPDLNRGISPDFHGVLFQMVGHTKNERYLKVIYVSIL